MPSLDGALPLPEDLGSTGVSDHLKLDMAPIFDELLHVKTAITKGADCFCACGIE